MLVRFRSKSPFFGHPGAFRVLGFRPICVETGHLWFPLGKVRICDLLISSARVACVRRMYASVRYSAATAGAPANSCKMLSAASRPSRIAQTTRDAPRTISPTAYTPGSAVEWVRKSAFYRAPARDFQRRFAPKCGQVFGFETKREDYQIGVFDVVCALDLFRALTARCVRRTKPHFRDHHAFDFLALESFRCRQPEEVDALFLGICKPRAEIRACSPCHGGRGI